MYYLSLKLIKADRTPLVSSWTEARRRRNQLIILFVAYAEAATGLATDDSGTVRNDSSRVRTAKMRKKKHPFNNDPLPAPPRKKRHQTGA